MTIDISGFINLPPDEFKKVLREMQEKGRQQSQESFFSSILRPELQQDMLDAMAYSQHATQEMRDDALAGIKELKQCERCEVYHDDPKHSCGSVALVHNKQEE